VLIRALSNETDRASIDMTPLIDMMFLLLIFFLVATTFHQEEREMQVALPFAEASGPISTTLREIIINVDEQGVIIVSGRPIEPGALRTMIEDAVATNPGQKVTVRGDRDAVYAHVVRALDICKGAGIQEPYLDTVIDDG
jgi:biopolymer transport protein ExbD